MICSRAMDSLPMHSARPWTPPEHEAPDSPESAYFSDPFRRASSCASEMEWPLLQPRPDTPGSKSKGADALGNPLSISRPKPLHTVTEPAPYTPTKTSSLLDHHATGALRYPYTPESSRILRPSDVGALSPIPWDAGSRSSASPVQNALSSCIAHFENLTATRELTDDQMEYIVGQFENMTSYLSAPDAQTKKGTDDLFFGGDSPRPASPESVADHAEKDESYIAEVGKYIEGVQIYTAELEKRFEETKALNEIQLAIIDNLRRDLDAAQQNMQSSLDTSMLQQTHVESLDRKNVNSSWESIETAVGDVEDENRPEAKVHKSAMVESGTQTDKPVALAVPHRTVPLVRRGFWAALYEALDGFSDDLHEP
ncbi:hypothetical protein E8E13_011161 [Curvularia kusanoi]|uniref:Uncharacterized protein n=1 Tax=Curvularia kusanoi TaxID=90978 RepID=A0A9P4WDV3_CURKU|nr:hypothetical protein E8E13_011161 [Curvularia kusanoi]